MPAAAQILGDHVGSTAPLFLALLALHVIAGLTAVVTGALAALTRKGSPRHIRAGRPAGCPIPGSRPAPRGTPGHRAGRRHRRPGSSATRTGITARA